MEKYIRGYLFYHILEQVFLNYSLSLSILQYDVY